MQRFWRKVEQNEHGCWVWQAAIRSDNGYGMFHKDGKMQLAHRVSWELMEGPIPDDYVVDHLCRNRACVNPSHLEPVTKQENTLRGEAPSAAKSRQTHCVHGHEFTEENTHVRKDGARRCRACARNRAKASRGSKVENLVPSSTPPSQI